jgi:tetratricopeptide (TPR) repeat protein
MHEIIRTKEHYIPIAIVGDYHIATNVVVSARNKKGPGKFYDDALILEKAYEKKDHLHPRYAFYAGECFRFSGKENWDKSIEWYKKSVNESWIQERYWSCYQIGKMYKELGEKEKALYWLFKSYEFDNSRQEAFFELIKECRADNQFEKGYGLYKMLKPRIKKDSQLFIINHIYDHSLFSEMLIILYYLNKFDEALVILKKLLSAEKPLEGYINITNRNMKYFIPHIKKDDWEFYAKFQLYSKKNNVPDDLKNKIDKIFET